MGRWIMILNAVGMRWCVYVAAIATFFFRLRRLACVYVNELVQYFANACCVCLLLLTQFVVLLRLDVCRLCYCCFRLLQVISVIRRRTTARFRMFLSCVSMRTQSFAWNATEMSIVHKTPLESKENRI